MVLMDTKAQSCLYLRGWANPDRERPLQGDPPGGSELPILESRSLADDDQSRHQVFSGDSDNPAGLGCARVFQKSGVRGKIRGEIRCQRGEIQCQFIILALKDEVTPDSPADLQKPLPLIIPMVETVHGKCLGETPVGQRNRSNGRRVKLNPLRGDPLAIAPRCLAHHHSGRINPGNNRCRRSLGK